MNAKQIQIKLSRFLVKHNKAFFFSTLVIISFFATYIPSLKFVSSPESYFMEDDKSLKNYHNFKSEFGDDNILIIAIEFADVFTQQSFSLIDSLTEKFSTLQNVYSIDSITNTKEMKGSDLGFDTSKIEIPTSIDETLILKERILSDPIYRNNLVSEDGKIAIFRIRLVEPKDQKAHKKTIKEIKSYLSINRIKEENTYFFSNTLLNIQMLSDIKTDLLRFLPLTFLVLMIVMFICFRDRAGVLVPTMAVFLSILSLGGLLGFFRIPINLISVALPSIMVCISSLDCIHIFTSFRRYYFRTKSLTDSVVTSLYENLSPCFFTTITTAIGFASMSISEVAPIKYFGRMACLSSFAAFLICFFCMPFLMLLFKTNINRKELVGNENQKELINLAVFYKYKKIILTLMLIILPISLWGFSKINIETSVINYIRNDRKIKKDALFMKDRFAGITNLELIVDSGEKNGAKNPQFLKLIETFEEKIKSKIEVKKIISFNTYLKKVNKAMHSNKAEYYRLPDSSKMTAEYILAYSLSGRENELENYVDYDYRKARSQIRILPLSSSKISSDLKAINKLAKEIFQNHYSFEVTSLYYLQTTLVEKITKGQIYSLLIAFLIVLIIVSLKYSSLTVGLFSLIPNGLPLLIILGIMGIFKIPLSAATSMISTIAFGLIVDDTLYFLHYFAKFSKQSVDREKVINEVIEKAGRALLYTSSILSVGFCILFFSQSNIIKDFGILISMTIFIAFVLDITVLPILLLLFPKLREEILKKGKV